jgi:hypothetical protein
MLFRRALAAGALCVLALDASASCGASFCVVNTDWITQGAWTEPGLRFDLRYEYVDQDQPRSGTDRVSVGQIPGHHDEVETRNRNTIAALDWNLSPAWSLSAILPYVNRDHFHIHNHHGEKLEDRWSLRGIGDAKVISRYQAFASADPAAPRSGGFTFGVKVPTGEHDQANGQGAVAERSLQPGSGTTDLIAGAWAHGGAPLEGWTWFALAQGQWATAERDGYKPGEQVQLDGGVRWALGASAALLLQANYLYKGRDSGVEAEPADSGQQSFFVSPGVSWNLSRDAQLYAFVQVPLWQKVNGVQLTADWSALAGVSWRF